MLSYLCRLAVVPLIAILVGREVAAQEIIDRGKRPTSYFDLMKLRLVIDDVGVQEDQRVEVSGRRRSAFAEITRRLQEAYTLAGDDTAERARSIKATLETVPEIEEQAFRDLLSDQQVERLRQIRRQAEVVRAGVSDVLFGMSRDGIELDDDQRSKIDEIAARTKLERVRLLKELREKEEREVFEALTPDQQEFWTRLMGPPLDVDQLISP